MAQPTIPALTLPTAKRILSEDILALGLNPRETRFIAAYCTNGFNATQAAQAAGYKANRKEFMSSLACDMVKRPGIQQAIKLFIDSVIGPYRDRLEYEVMDIYYRRATYDVGTFLEDDGNLKPYDEIPLEWRVCVDGIEREKKAIAGSIITMVSYRLPSRDVALQMLYKMVAGVASDDSTPAMPTDVRKRLDAIFKAHSGSSYTKKTSMTVEVTETKPGPRHHKVAPEGV